MTLYDLAGRRVRTLARGWFEGSQRVVSWDGRDEQGQPVAGGLYFVVARSGGAEHHLRLAVLR